ncbi:AAA family ATPase [Viscerimonas tarda]
MIQIENPFLITGYHSPDYFCDREVETKKITDALINGRNLTLLSPRRIGKTGLIKNVFYHLQKKRAWQTLYVDIMPTEDLSGFLKLFISAIVEQEQRQSKNYLQKIAGLLSGIRAKLSFNPVTSSPEIELDYATRQENEKNLSQLFHYLSQQNTNYAVALDEFQQITSYPEKGNIEALLRSHIQHLTNVHFIFSGSNRHLLSAMFSDYGRPFYQSSDFLYLEKINFDTYCSFICKKFAERDKNIGLELIQEAVEYYQTHTFYVQYFFNRLYENGGKKITRENIEQIHRLILEERDYIYYNYRNLLTNSQFNLLKAIAKEGAVSQPNASNFLTRYQLKQGSSVNRSMKSLIEKEMILEDKGVYCVYDVFFSKWLANI